jgi:hypothetical protein
MCCGPWPSCFPSPHFRTRGFPGGRARRAAAWGYIGDHAGPRSKSTAQSSRAGHILAARGLVVKQVDAAELKIVVGLAGSVFSFGRCGREICVLATCPFQFAKAGSAPALSLSRYCIPRVRCTAGRLYSSRRYTFVEFEMSADSFAADAPPPTHF